MRRHVFIISSTDLVALFVKWDVMSFHQQCWFGSVVLSLTWWGTAPVGWNPKPSFSPSRVSSRRLIARDPWWLVRCWLAAPAPSSGWTSWRLWGCGQVVSSLKELQLILLGCRCTQFPLALERADDLRSRAALGGFWLACFSVFFWWAVNSETLGMKSSHMWPLSPLASVFWCLMRELPVIPYQLWMLPLTMCSLFAAASVCFY